MVAVKAKRASALSSARRERAFTTQAKLFIKLLAKSKVTRFDSYVY